MFRVRCSAEVANTAQDGTGVRRVRIFKGTARERLVVIGRAPVDFAPPLPPEISADPHLLVEEVPAEKRRAPKVVDVDLSKLDYPSLVKLAKDLGIPTHGAKKDELREACAKAIVENAMELGPATDANGNPSELPADSAAG